MKPAKILYFIAGPAPSADDFAKAAEMQANVMFRNALAVPSEPHSLEIADGVMGEVPTIYANAYPDAEKAIAMKKKELLALTSKVGDSAPPKAKAANSAKNAQVAMEAGKVTAPGAEVGTPTNSVVNSTTGNESTAADKLNAGQTGNAAKAPVWNPNPTTPTA